MKIRRATPKIQVKKKIVKHQLIPVKMVKVVKMVKKVKKKKVLENLIQKVRKLKKKLLVVKLVD